MVTPVFAGLSDIPVVMGKTRKPLPSTSPVKRFILTTPLIFMVKY
jgi:hypothetical protein